jgi:aspartate beta-hydroxylase
MKLDYHIFKSMANGYLGLFFNVKQRPTFYDVKQVCPELDAVTQAAPLIRNEFDRLVEQAVELPQYHEVDPGERKIAATTPKRWNVFMLEVMGHKPAVNRARCPETCRVLERVPNMIQAFFSILDPGKSVPEHEGPYYGYLRYHLALRVPTDNPPKLVVNGQDHVWKENEAVLFDDSWPHSVVNHSGQTRAVLIVDVRRPLPAPADLFNRFLTNVIGYHTYGRSVMRKVEQYAGANAAGANTGAAGDGARQRAA